MGRDKSRWMDPCVPAGPDARDLTRPVPTAPTDPEASPPGG
jgi:hypothetical protein